MLCIQKKEFLKEMKTYSLDDAVDLLIGKKGTPKRDEFENELRLDLLKNAIQDGIDSGIAHDFVPKII